MDLQNSSEQDRILELVILANCIHPFTLNRDWLPTCGLCGQIIIGG